MPKNSVPSLHARTTAAWLRTQRRGVIAGVAASALHGASWVDDALVIEVISTSMRPQHGLVVRNETLADDEITWACKLPVTTRVRTAFDIGRYLSHDEAVARLDALMRTQVFSIEDVLLLAKRYPGARGLKSLRKVLPLVDGGADSPMETWLRLLYIDNGLPTPTTQIPVCDRRGGLMRDLRRMGWDVVQVIKEDRPDDIVARARAALIARSWRG